MAVLYKTIYRCWRNADPHGRCLVEIPLERWVSSNSRMWALILGNCGQLYIRIRILNTDTEAQVYKCVRVAWKTEGRGEGVTDWGESNAKAWTKARERTGNQTGNKRKDWKTWVWLGDKTKEQMMWEAQWGENKSFVGPLKLYGLCSSNEKPSRGFKIWKAEERLDLEHRLAQEKVPALCFPKCKLK